MNVKYNAGPSRYKAGDMLKFVHKGSPNLFYCIVVDPGNDAEGKVWWVKSGSPDCCFYQTVTWVSYNGIYEKVSK